MLKGRKRHSLKRQDIYQKKKKSDTTQILELPDREFKTILINMLWGLMENVNNMEEWLSNVMKQEDGNSKKESKGNARK